MRGQRIVAGLICAVALPALLMLSGCPQKADDSTAGGPGMIEEPAAPEEGQPAADAGEATGAATDMGITMAEIVSKWPESFAMTQTITDEDGKETVITSKMKTADGKPVAIRAEAPEGTSLIDYNEGVMYMWQSGSDTAMKLAIPEDAKSMPYEDVDVETKIVGEDLVGDVECWVAEMTKDDETVRTWLSKENGLFQRQEADGTTITFTYDEINSVPDSEFELPAGMTVQEMPQMPDMPEVPNG